MIQSQYDLATINKCKHKYGNAQNFLFLMINVIKHYILYLGHSCNSKQFNQFK